jgi:hypothetical protein
MEVNDRLTMEEETSITVKDKAAEGSDDPKVGNITDLVQKMYQKASDSRQEDEARWLRAYKNYRGVYGPDVQFREDEKSRVFIKVTKTKVLAAYGQIVEVLFGNDRFPITVDPTSLPEGVEEAVHFNPEEPPEAAAAAPKEMPKLNPGERFPDFLERIKNMAQELEPVKDKLKPGVGKGPADVTFYPAMVAAKKMQKKIDDQLEESLAKKYLRSAAFECALFGTGIMKGPFAVDKEYPNWDEEGNYTPSVKTMPHVTAVSIWDFFPDPDARTMEEVEYVVERHKMSRSQLRALKRRPFFRPNAIDTAISFGENYQKEWWEHEMEGNGETPGVTRFEVLEYWGFVDTEILEKDYSFPLPKEIKDVEQVSINAWVCNGQTLRVVLNPFKPAYLPYYAVPYEVNPYNIFGVGVAENMDDTQTLMNGFMRLAVDNAVLSSNLVFEVDESNLVPGQDMKIYPGKIFRRESGAPGQAIFAQKFPNVTGEVMQVFDKSRQLADESTGFPSFAHGQTGVTGVGRTASGISMLMSAANGAIKTVIKNFDDYLLAPLGKALFHFNMQFDFDPEIRGDLEVKAGATESLMANEVRSQRLMQFLGVVQNPVLAPFAKMDYIIREIARSMDLDPDKVANSMSAAAVQAEILKKFQGPQDAPPEEGMGAPTPPSPQDTQGSGGGMMGVGMAPAPGEQGFSANTGGGMPQ